MSSAPEVPATPMNERYTFSTFVTGPSNQLAAAAAQTVAENPGTAYNPLFVFGRVGLGKTHLAQAIGHFILDRAPGSKIVYQTTEQFVNDVIGGIRFERMDEIRATYRNVDVLIIDDLGTSSLDAAQRLDLREILEDRYSVSSTIITSQLDPKHWHSFIGDETLADAICDRLVHNAHHIDLLGGSIREELGTE